MSAARSRVSFHSEHRDLSGRIRAIRACDCRRAERGLGRHVLRPWQAKSLRRICLAHINRFRFTQCAVSTQLSHLETSCKWFLRNAQKGPRKVAGRSEPGSVLLVGMDESVYAVGTGVRVRGHADDSHPRVTSKHATQNQRAYDGLGLVWLRKAFIQFCSPIEARQSEKRGRKSQVDSSLPELVG